MKRTNSFLKAILFYSGMFFSIPFFAQITNPVSSIRGNFQVDGQYYFPDSLINAPTVPEKFLTNGFGNVNFIHGNFSAGFRYENYLNVMTGFLPQNRGTGIPYRYARYRYKDLDFTLGSFYDQFGSGLIFRSYEARGLLFDNAMDGIRLIYSPIAGMTLKGFVARQRTFFTQSPGIVRAFDGEWNLSEFFGSNKTRIALKNFRIRTRGALNKLLRRNGADTLMLYPDSAQFAPYKTQVIVGGSFVSKYQEDQDPTYNLPLNVGCYGGRLNLISGGFNLFAESAYKINDPSFSNSYSYRDGKGIFVNTSYATKGFSMQLAGKMIDNMSFRSDRTAKLTTAMMNFLPALTKPHTYLMMTYYPYATQPNGEVGAMAEIQYKAKKGTRLGGKYGWEMTINSSVAFATDTMNRNPAKDPSNYLYDINYSGTGGKYFHDFNIDFTKKFSKTVKGTFMYANQYYNKNMVQFGSPNAGYDTIISNILVADVTWRYKTGQALRFEFQTLQAHKWEKNKPDYFKGDTADYGSWVTGMVEWTISSNWFLTVLDQWNYSNPDPERRIHYYLFNVTYVRGPTRIVLQYGKQREGIFCVGGVCRFVPSSNGFSMTVSSSF